MLSAEMSQPTKTETWSITTPEHTGYPSEALRRTKMATTPSSLQPERFVFLLSQAIQTSTPPEHPCSRVQPTKCLNYSATRTNNGILMWPIASLLQQQALEQSIR